MTFIQKQYKLNIKEMDKNENSGAMNEEVQATTNPEATESQQTTAQSETKTESEGTSTEKSESTSTEAPTASTVPAVVSPKKEEDEIKLEFLEKEFVYDLMSVPTKSNEEYRMVTYVTMWARRNGIKYEFDDYGNIYLTKGELEEGEFYPCVTSHLDTVQDKQKSYAQVGCRLPLKTRKTTTGNHELYVDGMGIGADDKTGILISLSLFKHVDKLKACFFLEEETGMGGSDHMNVEWFNNVGYVIGWDSPDRNRAAWACSGVKLFSKDFFENQIKDVCAKYGLTDFRSEPFTDVKNIRKKTNLICMNFGNGGYAAHSQTEYMVIEDTERACAMGVGLLQHLGTQRFLLSSEAKEWKQQPNGIWGYGVDEDEEYFKRLNHSSYGGYGGYSSGYYRDYDDDYGYNDYWRTHQGAGANGSSSQNSTKPATTTPATQTTTTPAKTKEMVNAENVKYIVEQYEKYIENLHKELDTRFETLGIDPEIFKDIFETHVVF